MVSSATFAAWGHSCAHLTAGPDRPLSSNLAARLLAGVELGRLDAEPIGLSDPTDVGDPWTALRFAPDVVYNAGGTVSLGLVLQVPPQGVVFRPEPLVLRANLTFEIAFR
jgi:hypothetical protein